MSWLTDLRVDVGFALRLYRRTPLFTLVVVLSLALGIGVNTALFSLADALLLRPLPVARPHELVQVNRLGPGGAGPVVSYPTYQALAGGSAGVASLLATGRVWRWNLRRGSEAPERVSGELVSGNYFDVLGVAATAGRLLDARDDARAPAVVLSDAYWARRFARDPRLLGARLTINGAAFTVAGVARPGFTGLELADPVDLWAPLAAQPLVLGGSNRLVEAGSNWIRVLARPAPGVAPPAVQAAAHAAFRHALAARGMDNEERIVVADGRWGFSKLRERLGRPMLLLAGLVGIVLFIACANVATLLLARAAHRQRELAVRLALGGGRGRLVRQWMTESLLLSLVGAGLGLYLAWMGKDLLLALLFARADRVPVTVALDGRVLLFTAGLGLVTAVLAGFLPARQVWSMVPAAGMHGDRATARRSPLTGIALPAVQLGLSFVLLAGAGLFARSLAALREHDPGFERERVLAVRLDVQAAPYTPAQFADLHRRLLQTARALPGVRAAALADQALFTRPFRQQDIAVEGFAPRPGADLNPFVLEVSPGFFPALGTPVVEGRTFEERDLAAGAPPVAVVNRSFARYYFGEASAVGRRLRAHQDGVTVIGVVEDAKYHDLREPARHLLYAPLGPGDFPDRSFFSESTLAIRTAGDPRALGEALRRALAASDPALPVVGMATLAEHVERSLAQDRLLSALSALFGAVALLLTCIGVYGVCSYGVSRQRRELGVRLALGARPAQVRWMVAARSARMLGWGLLLGLPGALAAAQLARGVLFEVSPLDPGPLGIALATLVLITFLASWGPARAAARVDPMVALRAE